MARNIKIIIISFLLLFLSGCGTPKNSEFAFMGFWGIYLVFLISLCTLFFYYHFKNKKPRDLRKNFRTFRKNNKSLFWIILILVIFNLLLSTILDFSGSITSDHPKANLGYSFDRLFDSMQWEENFDMVWIVSMVVLVFSSIPIIVYSLLLIFLFNKNKKLTKFTKYIPLIITFLYIITLFIVVLYDPRESLHTSLLMIWLWPYYVLFLFGSAR